MVGRRKTKTSAGTPKSSEDQSLENWEEYVEKPSHPSPDFEIGSIATTTDFRGSIDGDAFQLVPKVKFYVETDKEEHLIAGCINLETAMFISTVSARSVVEFCEFIRSGSVSNIKGMENRLVTLTRFVELTRAELSRVEAFVAEQNANAQKDGQKDSKSKPAPT